MSNYIILFDVKDCGAAVEVPKAYMSAGLDVQRQKRVKEPLEIEVLRPQMTEPTGQSINQQQARPFVLPCLGKKFL